MNAVNLFKDLDVKTKQLFFQCQQDLFSDTIDANKLFEILSEFVLNENKLLSNIQQQYSEDTSYVHISDLIINYFGSDTITKILYEYVISNYSMIWRVAVDEDSETHVLDVEEKKMQMTQKCRMFNLLNWGDIYQHVILDAMSNIISLKVETVCKGVYDEVFLASLYDWIDVDIKYYISMYLNDAVESPAMHGITMVCCEYVNQALYNCRSSEMFDIITEYPDSKPCLNELKDVLNGHTNKYHSFVQNNKHGGSDDSLLISSVSTTGGTGGSSYKQLGHCLRTTMQKRLLHPGASTVQILDLYITMIKTLRELDPLDILLNYVTADIRRYLKQRHDTIRCIVSSLVQAYGLGLASADSNNTEGLDLYAELKKGGASLESNTYIDDSDNEEDGPGVNWEPRKRDKSLQNRLYSNNLAYGMDVIALLVSIYGSTDVFVSEYRYLLNTRLIYHSLSAPDTQAHIASLYDIDREIANLELLKIRFGDESLHDCEVMLHDVENSKRVNAAIASEIKRTSLIEKQKSNAMQVDEPDGIENVVDCMLISDAYWPCIHDVYNSHEYEMQTVPKTDEIVLNNTLTEINHYHPVARELLLNYHSTFRILKNPRRLLLYDDSLLDTEGSEGSSANSNSSNLGFVELDLDFEDGTQRYFVVPPLMASIVLHVADMSYNSVISLSKLIELLEYSGCSDMTDIRKQLRSKLAYWTRMGVLKQHFQQGDVSSDNNSLNDLKKNVCVGDDSVASPFSGLLGANKATLDSHAQQECYYSIIENQLEHAQSLGYETVEEYHGVCCLNSMSHTSMKSDDESLLPQKSDSNSKQMLETCEQFIHGLLINHKTMTLERLYSMLKMLAEASDGSSNNSGAFVFEMTQVQLRNHLSVMTERELVEYFDGTYSLPKQ